MSNGWSGGQYSLFRALLGAYLLVHHARLLPWAAQAFAGAGRSADPPNPWARLFPNLLALHDGPAIVRALLVLGGLAALLLALGAFDRIAAVVLAYIGACLLGRNPLIASPASPLLGGLLLAHALVPGAPYGSWKARGRADPRGGWAMPRPLFLAAWIVVALGYGYRGLTRLTSPSWIDGTALAGALAGPLARPGPLRDLLLLLPPAALGSITWGGLGLDLLFAPLALWRRLRPWVWLGQTAAHVGLLVLFDFADLALALLLVQLFIFDPAWVRPRGARTERLFYDGHCALCHGTVRFVLAEDRAGTALDFAPLQGPRLEAAVGPAVATGLPDSLALLTEDRRLLVRSSAVAHVLARLGGLWRVLGALLAAIPRPARDAAYSAVARARHRVFGRRADLCPIVPEDLRGRFDLGGAEA
jgi:predicted DCC family thiol-disulfide oxidoreductase YuxK